MSGISLQDNTCGLKVSTQENVDSMVHSIASAGDLRSIHHQRLQHAHAPGVISFALAHSCSRCPVDEPILDK
jgi:hypothetical protein